MQERIISIQDVANIESNFEPGKIPEQIWLEHLRLHAVATIETTPYRFINGKLQVYMKRRPSSDRDYPNQLHMPGTMVNGNDLSEEDAINRIKEKEMNGLLFGKHEKVTSYIRKTPRGTEAVFLYVVPVYQGGDIEHWFDIDHIPNDTIEHHKKMIEIASKKIYSNGQKRQTAAFE